MSETFKMLKKQRDEYKDYVGSDTSTAAHKIFLVLDQLVGKASRLDENQSKPSRSRVVGSHAHAKSHDQRVETPRRTEIRAAQIRLFHISS